MRRSIAGLAILTALAGCSGSGNGGGGKPATKDRTVTLFALAELRGQIEPCGCTTDPLGDLARTTSLIEEARSRGPVVVLDAGSTLYSRSPVPAHLAAQEALKADLIVKAYADELEVAAIGLGPMDLAKGAAQVRPARQAANVTGVPTEPPKVIEAGGARIGVFGVTGPGMAPGLEVGDPVAAATQAIATLRDQKADAIVALMTMEKKAAVALLEEVDGIDFAILGLGRETPEPDKVSARAEDVDGTWLVIPANRGQVVSRIDLTLRPGGEQIADAVGEAAAAALGVELDARIESLAAELARFEADPAGDAAFIARKRGELEELRAQRERLTRQPLQVPANGSYFTFAQIPIKKQIACDAELQAAKLAYSKAAGEANVLAAKDDPPPPPAKGKAGYVGVEACSDCHEEAVAFWERTRHVGAWETLEASSKQFDHECTSCHVTGWDQPGGSNMAFNEGLRDVQCETCHGPGSLHVEAETDKQAKATIRRDPPADLCATQCHTPEHSDTFQLEAYLRDVVGPGHGEARRKALGDGPTGRELRAAGLEKAGKLLGAGCLK